jgi:hypothetical protein
MISQLESAFNITVDNDKAVSNTTDEPSPIGNLVFYPTLQTLMSVVDQLDQTLFEKFIKPKVTVVTGKLRGGILDPKMDWYETPQPTGEHYSSAPHRASLLFLWRRY